MLLAKVTIFDETIKVISVYGEKKMINNNLNISSRITFIFSVNVLIKTYNYAFVCLNFVLT